MVGKKSVTFAQMDLGVKAASWQRAVLPFPNVDKASPITFFAMDKVEIMNVFVRELKEK